MKPKPLSKDNILPVPIDSTLDQFESVRHIVINPVHKDKAYKLNINYANEINKNKGIFFLNQPQIHYNENVPAQTESGKEYFERTELLKHPFIEWVTDTENPPSWAIFFGFVKKKKKMVDCCFVLKDFRYEVDWLKPSKENYDDNQKRRQIFMESYLDELKR